MRHLLPPPNVHADPLTVTKTDRQRIKGHKPAILWFTGLSGAGKSTVANLVEADLASRRIHTILLDGDHLRKGLNKDLGFSQADRAENLRRVAEIAKIMLEGGLIVICAFVSPFAAQRQLTRKMFESDEFFEIFVDTPLEICMARDPKGLYKKAVAGGIKNFTGLDQAYERPLAAELIIDGHYSHPKDSARRVLRMLAEQGVLPPQQI